MKITIKFLLAVALCCGLFTPLTFTGCTSSQRTTTFNSLYTVEHTTVAAYDGYVRAIIKGDASTNGLPAVSSAFNKFQASFAVALDAAQFNTNALAPESLVIEGQDVLNVINQFKGKK